MNEAKLGISHSLPEDTLVVHSSIQGATCLGRVTDVLSAWAKHKLELPEPFLSSYRLLMQSLLEFSCPKAGDSLGQVELANHDGFMILATRFPCGLSLSRENLSKELTQFWLNSEELKLFKKMLNAHDRVEVRYHQALNLIEWRVLRRVIHEENIMDHSSSFSVMLDQSTEVTASPVVFQDLGDLDFGNWLGDAYRNTKLGSRAGNVTVEGGESQDDKEWARVVVEREKEAIEKEIETGFKNGEPTEEEMLQAFISHEPSEDDDEWTKARRSLTDEEIEKILLENANLKEATKEMKIRIRKLELVAEQDKMITTRKISEMEKLLKRKEYVNQRHQAEIAQLSRKMKADHEEKDTVRSDHFRLKAIEMFEKLKKTQEDMKTLERANFELRRNTGAPVTDAPTTTSMSQKYVDELNKKMERTQRALDAEKLKVNSLSERVTVAEKEAQASAPLIDDLESKVENTLKAVQQHKKEAEQVKLKLVQSDAEKNKVKNDLMKAQAQIQTLMKRQAS